MKILINFSTLKSGGGQNVAMNFLHAIENMNVKNISLYYFIAKGSSIHKYFLEKKYTNYYVVPSNPIQRILFEIFISNKILLKQKIDVIYSYFGIGFFSKAIPQVSGSADSNLYFPEVDFWSHYHSMARVKKKLIDLYRVWGIKRATAVVFENKALEKRAHELYKLKKTITIKPSINFDFNSKEYILPVIVNRDIPIGLFLCGWQYNKNIMLIPSIALELKKNKQDFHFLLTAPIDNSTMHQEFLSLVHNYEISDMITITGPIDKEMLASLYSKTTFVFLLSKLESFSNNIIESWFFKKPLVVSDELWSREICKDVAIYVDRDSVSDIANKLLRHIANPELLNDILDNSKKVLDEYPSISERIEQEMEYIQNVYKNN